MSTVVRKTIYLPLKLAREAEQMARAEGKTLSALIQDALLLARQKRPQKELRQIQGYWSRKAREKGILTEQELRQLLYW